MKNPWKTIKKNIIFQNKFGYTLRDDDVVTPSGKNGKYTVFENNGYVTIVAINDQNNVIMTEQWRYPVEKSFIELPAGSINGDEKPLRCAQRELLEETGITANKWKKIGSYWIGNGVLKMQCHTFLAQSLTYFKKNQEDTEKIKTKLYKFSDLVDKIRNQKIHEEKTIIGLLLAEKYL